MGGAVGDVDDVGQRIGDADQVAGRRRVRQLARPPPRSAPAAAPPGPDRRPPSARPGPAARRPGGTPRPGGGPGSTRPPPSVRRSTGSIAGPLADRRHVDLTSGAVDADQPAAVVGRQPAAVLDQEAHRAGELVGLLRDDLDGQFLAGQVGAGQLEDSPRCRPRRCRRRRTGPRCGAPSVPPGNPRTVRRTRSGVERRNQWPSSLPHPGESPGLICSVLLRPEVTHSTPICARCGRRHTRAPSPARPPEGSPLVPRRSDRRAQSSRYPGPRSSGGPSRVGVALPWFHVAAAMMASTAGPTDTPWTHGRVAPVCGPSAVISAGRLFSGESRLRARSLSPASLLAGRDRAHRVVASVSAIVWFPSLRAERGRQRRLQRARVRRR